MKLTSALRWSFIGQVSYIVLYFTFNLILSRILSPTDFGVYAIVNTFIIFFSLIKDFGLGNYLITTKDISKQLCDTIFYSNLLFTTLLCLIILLVSPYIALFYQDPRLTVLIRLSALTFIIDAICTVPNAMLIRKMDFFRLFILKVSSISLAGVSAIILALSGWGIYSLVLQAILISLLSGLVLFYFYPYLPGANFERSRLKAIGRFSLPLFFDQFIQYFSRNLDNLIIGRLFGPFSLGLYNRAYTIMQMPLQNISSSVSSVLLPVLSSSVGDLDRLSAIYRKAISGIAFISFPLMGYVFVYAHEVIYFLYGSKWAGVSDILMIFSIVGMLETIIVPSGTLLMSSGKTFQLLKFSTSLRVVIISMIVIGSFFSTIGIALCYMIATILITPYVLFYVSRELDKPIIFLASPLVKIFLVTVASVLLLLLVKVGLSGFNLIAVFCISGIFYFSAYLFISFWVNRSLISDSLSIIISKKP